MANPTGKGGFRKGGPGGPGRPKKAREAAYLRATLAACPPSKWRQVVEKAVEDALSPIPALRAVARKFLGDALIGRDPVTTRLLVDRAEAVLERLDEEDRRREHERLGGPPAALPCGHGRDPLSPVDGPDATDGTSGPAEGTAAEGPRAHEPPPLPPGADANEWEYALEGDVDALDLAKEEERNGTADRPAQG